MIARSHLEKTLQCHHCGQLVIGSGIGNLQQEIFCCEGCLSISNWLGHEKMGEYYDLLSQAGKRAPQAFLGKDYQEFLNTLKEPQALQTLGRWQGPVHQLTLTCKQISCAACA